MLQTAGHAYFLRSVIISFSYFASCLISETTLCAGEPPAITSIFPAGIQQGKTAQIKLNGKSGELPLSIWSSCDDFEKLTISEKGNQLILTANNKAAAGLHWLRFYNKSGAGSLLPILVGTLPEISEKEPNNDFASAGKIKTLPVTINGILNKSAEVDTYQVSLKKGEMLIASVEAHHSLASPMDTVLQILDDRRFVLAQNDDDHGNDSLLHFRTTQDGNYYIRVYCFPSKPNSSINFAGGANDIYRLTLTKTVFLAYQFEVYDGGQKKFARAGWNHSGKTAPFFQLASALLSAPGLHQLHQGIDTPVKIEYFKSNNNPITVPSTRFGLIQTRSQKDIHTIKAKKNDSFHLQVHARKFESLLDPVLMIKNSDGKVLKQGDDIAKTNLDVDLTWKAPADGQYSLEVIDRYDHFGPRYFYLMAIEKEEPRFELSVEQDHYMTSAEKPLEIAVTVKRITGYKGEISIQADNLPEGCICEAVASAEKGDSAKQVTLKIDAKKSKPFNGPIQIIGRGNGKDKLKINATASLKVLNRTTSNIWLTVPEAKKK